jgi:hypothetical protein
MSRWSNWRPFPNPLDRGILIAPFGPGCYELRHKDGRLVLYGRSSHAAVRMSSLLPRPLGTGTRNNADKRAYVKGHLSDLEYRTLPCLTAQEAKDIERKLKRNARHYVFGEIGTPRPAI